MATDFPTYFDLCNTTDWLNAAEIGAVSNATNIKTAGGLNLSDSGVAFQSDLGVEGGAIMNLNAGATSVDWTDKLFLISHTFNAPNRLQFDTAANNGWTLWVFSTVQSDFKEWIIGGNDTFKGKNWNGHTVVVIDPARDAHISGGTYVQNSTIAWGMATTPKDISESAGTSWGYFSRALLMGHTKSDSATPRIYGNPCTMKELHEDLETVLYSTVEYNYTTQLGSTYIYNCPFIIGNSGVTATAFDDEGVTIVSPLDDDPADPRFQLTLESMRFYLDLQSGDTATFSGAYEWGTRAVWDMNAPSTTTVTFNNPKFKGMGKITIGDGVSGSATFDDVDTIIMATSSNLDASTFTNTFGTHALEIG